VTVSGELHAQSAAATVSAVAATVARQDETIRALTDARDSLRTDLTRATARLSAIDGELATHRDAAASAQAALLALQAQLKSVVAMTTAKDGKADGVGAADLSTASATALSAAVSADAKHAQLRVQQRVRADAVGLVSSLRRALSDLMTANDDLRRRLGDADRSAAGAAHRIGELEANARAAVSRAAEFAAARDAERLEADKRLAVGARELSAAQSAVAEHSAQLRVAHETIAVLQKDSAAAAQLTADLELVRHKHTLEAAEWKESAAALQSKLDNAQADIQALRYTRTRTRA
jgi:chromosome segregation ATPase